MVLSDHNYVQVAYIRVFSKKIYFIGERDGHGFFIIYIILKMLRVLLLDHFLCTFISKFQFLDLFNPKKISRAVFILRLCLYMKKGKLIECSILKHSLHNDVLI